MPKNSYTRILEGWNNELSLIRFKQLYTFHSKMNLEHSCEQFIPKAVKPYMSSIQFARIIQWVENPNLLFEKQAIKKRDQWVKLLLKGDKKLEERLVKTPQNGLRSS